MYPAANAKGLYRSSMKMMVLGHMQLYETKSEEWRARLVAGGLPKSTRGQARSSRFKRKSSGWDFQNSWHHPVTYVPLAIDFYTYISYMNMHTFDFPPVGTSELQGKASAGCSRVFY